MLVVAATADQVIFTPGRSALATTCSAGYIAHVASTFEVLAEPRRRQILDLLRGGERPVGELVEELTLTQPTVSKHLRVLREAGLVEVRHDAQRRWYRLRPEPLAEIDAWLAPYRQLWTASLDALERHLDAMPDEPEGTT
jgi:DNA-binding transcriptional ArsR family regulator